jgi:hypothetical protein
VARGGRGGAAAPAGIARRALSAGKGHPVNESLRDASVQDIQMELLRRTRFNQPNLLLR